MGFLSPRVFIHKPLTMRYNKLTLVLNFIDWEALYERCNS